MKMLLAVAAGGALGAMARYGVYVLGERSREATLRQLAELGWGEFTDKRLRNVVRRARRDLAWELHRRNLLDGISERGA